MITIPPYLNKGDTIAVVCPSGFMPYEKAETCINTLQQWGFKVKVSKTLGNQFNYFAGTDAERLHDLQQALNDKEVKAILCGRGGYGVSRIIDDIDFTYFKKHPKWIIGFSDITLLQSHIFTKYKIATLHSPMAAAFNDGEANKKYVLSLKNALYGKPAIYKCKGNNLNIEGTAKAKLVGGNLAMLAHTCGTSSCFKTKNKILFIEDIGEYIYNIDRMLIQVKRAGLLDDLESLIIGGFTDMKDTTIPFGDTLENIIFYHIKDYGYPVCFDFPVSHAKENYALKIGAEYKLEVTKKTTSLTEIN